MTTLIIDNYDSFTYNLVQGIGELGGQPRVFRNDALSVSDVERLSPSHILISPGPGGPAEGGISGEVVRRFSSKIPILGVCLGHQVIAHELGARVVLARQVVHGRDSLVYHDEHPLWRDIPNPFVAGRYHSLVVESEGLPDDLLVSAWTSCGLVMGLRHRIHPLFGVQFHPESILTPQGLSILRNFLRLQVRSQDLPGGEWKAQPAGPAERPGS